MILIHWNMVTTNRKIAHVLTLIFGKRSYIHQNLIKKLIKYIPICFKKNVKSINSVLNTSSPYRSNIITGTRDVYKATSKQKWREADVI